MKTRDRILETALHLFNAEGLAQVSTNRIAAELAMSPGNLHYHFKRKEDLVTWLLRRFAEALRRFADAHETVEALDDLWLTMHLGLEVLDHHRFILRDMDFLLREYPALHAPLRELIGQRIATLQAALESLRRRDILQATDEQLASLALQTVLANTAWPSVEHLLPAAMPGTLRGSRAVAYHFLVMLSPYVDDASRQYLAYLRSRYAA